MTDDKRSQEAEDVALTAAHEIVEAVDVAEWNACNVAAPPDEVDAYVRQEQVAAIRPILARLVREGQIRVLEVLAVKQCWLCEGAEVPQVHRDNGLCNSEQVHARIAALRQEG